MNLTNRAKGISASLTLAITAKAAKMKKEGLDIISFGAGEPDFDTPDFIKEAAIEALNKGITRYTDASGTPDLRKAIALDIKKNQGLDYDFNQIIVSNGAKHSLYNALAAVVQSGDEVIYPAPYWLTYPELVKLCDAAPIAIDTKSANYKLTPSLLKKAVTKKTKAIILNNPSNPSGIVYTKDEIFALAKELENHKDIVIISDEIYDQLSYETKIVSIACYSEAIKARTVIVNGVSKSYAMTGWRIGYTASTLETAKAMGNIQSHATSNPNSIAQYATQKALTDPRGDEFLSKMNTVFKARRDMMAKIIRDAGLNIISPGGAFYIMIDVSPYFGKELNGRKLKGAQCIAEILLDEALVAVVPLESFGADNFIRLSYATSDEMIKKGLERIVGLLKKLK
ncbi:MAG: pyridoxal phosphate-dependent aminotransferase [Firmicutes bacterium]|nr:pyridoxal phosphate-dependent aminotransferase [Bacillota bacterium]